MGLSMEDRRGAAQWTSDRTLYLVKGVVKERLAPGDQGVLLVSAGGHMDRALADSLGLTAPPVPEPTPDPASTSKAMDAPPLTKAVRGPKATK